METFSDSFNEDFPWQATLRGIYLNIRDETVAALQGPKILEQELPKKLTTEAILMIYVMLAFILLAVLGSSITAYEIFFKGKRKETRSGRNNCDENDPKRMRKIQNRVKYQKSLYGNWLESCKYFFNCFCMIKNGGKILNTDFTENQINCIQGMRFVCNAFLIFVHTSSLYSVYARDQEKLRRVLDLEVSQLVSSGLLAVDVFFVISGFLNAFYFFKKYSKFNGSISWINFYFKRFVRLTPVYMISLGFYTTLFSYSGTGIIWPTYNTNPVCRKDWWWYLLYINNFEESVRECMLWCWYLATEMQFYIISPLFMISLRRCPRFGYALLIACICGSCAASFILTYKYNVADGMSRFRFHLNNQYSFMHRFFEYYDIIYKKPYTRIGQYSVGLILGYYLHQKTINKCVIRNSKMSLCCGWAATASFMWISCFSLHSREEILIETSFFNGIKFLFTSCSAAWIIYVCFTGQAEFLNKCLSWKALLPLSRLTYCAYLTHVIVLMKVFLQSENVMDFSLMFLVSLNVYVFVCTYIISFMTSMIFEIPLLNLLDLLGKESSERISSVSLTHYKTNTGDPSDVHKIS